MSRPIRRDLRTRRAHRVARVAIVLATVLASVSTLAAQTGAPPTQASAVEPKTPAQHRQRLLEIEDLRDSSPSAVAEVLEASKHKDTETRRLAARTLGRLERTTLAAAISQSLADFAPVVRAEAADALVENAHAGGDMALISELLFAQIERETHPLTRGMLAMAIGRLPYTSGEAARRAEAAIVATITGPQAAESERTKETPSERLRYASPLTLLGALRGLEAWTRLNGQATPPAPATVQLLKDLVVVWRSAVARAEGGPTVEAAARLRRLALRSLLSVRAVDALTLSTAFGDGDDQVRQLAAVAATTVDPIDSKLLERAIRDQSPLVRAALLEALAQRKAPSTCGYVALVLQDPSPAVAMAALDVAGRACGGNQPLTATIAAMAGRLQPPALGVPGAVSVDDGDPARGIGVTSSRGIRRATWQVPTQALLTLAHLSPDDAQEKLTTFARDARWQVRVYAARAAALTKSEDTLRQLATDERIDVVDEAIVGLSTVAGHTADEIYLRALRLPSATDQTIARSLAALQGTTRRDDVVDALFAALDGIDRRPRDSEPSQLRLALLQRVEQVGGPEAADRLAPYRQNGRQATADANRPSPADLETLNAARFVVTVRDVGRFEVRLLGQEAPLNAWWFYRLAREKAFNGMTVGLVAATIASWHTEGNGDARPVGGFRRQERSLQSNTRGALAVLRAPQRDPILVVNVVDNPEFDDTATVFGHVERGAEVLDALFSDDVIERIDVTTRQE